MAEGPICRNCGVLLLDTFLDLGNSPLANSFPRAEQCASERRYPLRVFVCRNCFLVQLPEHESPEVIFSDYAYFSSFSTTWLSHAKRYCLEVVDRFHLGLDSFVVEVASNDGYLLRNFLSLGIPALGVEPAANTARVAQDLGIPCEVAFFTAAKAAELVQRYRRADLVIGNNVLAHVPNLHDFIDGLRLLLADEGTITMEFPHLLQLVDHRQFDTIYHEHYSYFSLLVVCDMFRRHGLTVFDVEELDTHGGSLRIFAGHSPECAQHSRVRVNQVIEKEVSAGYHQLPTYTGFASVVDDLRSTLVGLLKELKAAGASIVGYGAPAKGNTLLNFCGLGPDTVTYTVDRNPEKQGRLLPGSHIPIQPVRSIWDTRPNYVLILPWNLKDEIMDQLAGIRDWGGKFIIPIPAPHVV